jgi:twitching motility protein PilT
VSLVPSLLQAIVRVDGDALVMHAGDKPYVVSPTGQVDLASRGLSLEAVDGIVAQLLPVESRNALEEFGAVQYELLSMPEFPGEHFTVVAARGGDDLWVEVRRRRVPDEDRIPDDLFAASAPVQAEDDRVPVELLDSAPAESPDAAEKPQPEHVTAVAAIVEDEDLALPAVAHLFPAAEPPEPVEPKHEPQPEPEKQPEPETEPEAVVTIREAAVPPPTVVAAPAVPVAAPVDPPTQQPAAVSTRSGVRSSPPPVRQPTVAVSTPSPRPVTPPPPVPSPEPAVVLPMTRNPIRADQPAAVVGDPTMGGLQRLLRISAARGATALYLSTGARPSVRVDGELQTLDSEPVLEARDIESLLLTLMLDRSHEALRTCAPSEWMCDIAEVGRVRCTTFRDHGGPGGVFRLMPTKTVSADQLGLPRAVQALALEPEGIILVVGSRSSGKRTLIAAFVDLINRTRRDHVITIERDVDIVHSRGSSFISQREIRGSEDEIVAAARAALRENPDVLVIEDLRTGSLIDVALEAAASGHLVIGGFTAHSATAAIDRIIDLYAPEQRPHVQLAIADTLRGVVAQVLVRKIGGGRVAAREVLLNTAAVSGAIAEGKTSQLPMAIEGGRRHGTMPLNDALVSLVQSGAIDAREAYRYASDRGGLLAALKRQGIDVSQLSSLNSQVS